MLCACTDIITRKVINLLI